MLVSIILASACKKDDNSREQETCKIIQYTETSGNGTPQVFAFHYNEQGDLVSGRNPGSSFVWEVDQQDGLITLNHYHETEDFMESHITTLSADGRPSIHRRSIPNHQTFKALTYTMTYDGLNMTAVERSIGHQEQVLDDYTKTYVGSWDGNGNLVRYGSGTSVTEYSYYTDKLRNDFPEWAEIQKIGYFMITNYSKHLTKSSISRDVNTGVETGRAEYTYIFDEQGRIARRTIVFSPQGIITHQDYEYSCQ